MDDLAGLCPAISSDGYVYVCPNAPIPVEIGLGVTGYAWVPPAEEGVPEHAQQAEEMLLTLFEEVSDRYGVRPGEMVLGGFSQGGMMTYRCGLTNRHVFRGLAVLSGWIEDAEGLRPRLPDDRGQRIFVAHGTNDALIPVERARDSRAFLQEEGYRPTYREYAMGHEISQKELVDFAAWLRDVLPPVRQNPEGPPG